MAIRPGIAMPASTRRHFAKVAFLNAWVNDWGRLGRWLAVEAHRASARRACGLVLDGARLDPSSVAVRRLLDAAAVDHRIRNPRSRGDNHWIFEFASEPLVNGVGSAVVNARTGKQSTLRFARVLCRYCRARLVDPAQMRYDYSRVRVVREHVVECAVSFLASGRMS